MKEAGGGEAPDAAAAAAAREMVAGVRAYFDQCLRHFLLYSHEVAAADEALRGSEGAGAAGAGQWQQGEGAAGGGAACRRVPGLPRQPPPPPALSCSLAAARPAPSALYGAEHLVRLFVKLPELVPVAYMVPPVSCSSTARARLLAAPLPAHLPHLPPAGRLLALVATSRPPPVPCPRHRMWCAWSSSCRR